MDKISNLTTRNISSLIKSGSTRLLTNPHVYRRFIYAKRTRNEHLYDVETDVITTISAQPSKINQVNRSFHRYWNTGDIISGDWDTNNQAVSELPWYKGVTQRYDKKIDWEDTELFEYMCKRLESDGTIDMCYSKSDILERLSSVDDLYNSLKQEGYKKNKDPCDYSDINRNSFECVCVHVSRSGELLFKGGAHHRLVLSKYLDLERIPMRIIVRHSDWQNKREKGTCSTEHPDAPYK